MHHDPQEQALTAAFARGELAGRQQAEADHRLRTHREQAADINAGHHEARHHHITRVAALATRLGWVQRSCRACGARIVIIDTADGRKHAVDPDLRGHIETCDADAGRPSVAS